MVHVSGYDLFVGMCTKCHGVGPSSDCTHPGLEFRIPKLESEDDSEHGRDFQGNQIQQDFDASVKSKRTLRPLTLPRENPPLLRDEY